MRRTRFIEYVRGIWEPRLVSRGFEPTSTDNGDDFPFALRYQKQDEDRCFIFRLQFYNKTVKARVQGIVRFPAFQKGIGTYLDAFTEVGFWHCFNKVTVENAEIIEPLFWDDVEDSIFPMFDRHQNWDWFDQFSADELRKLARPKERLFFSHRSIEALFFARMHQHRSNFELAIHFATTGLEIEGMLTCRDYDGEFREIVRNCRSQLNRN